MRLLARAARGRQSARPADSPEFERELSERIADRSGARPGTAARIERPHSPKPARRLQVAAPPLGWLRHSSRPRRRRWRARSSCGADRAPGDRLATRSSASRTPSRAARADRRPSVGAAERSGRPPKSRRASPAAWHEATQLPPGPQRVHPRERRPQRPGACSSWRLDPPRGDAQRGAGNRRPRRHAWWSARAASCRAPT